MCQYTIRGGHTITCDLSLNVVLGGIDPAHNIVVGTLEMPVEQHRAALRIISMIEIFLHWGGETKCTTIFADPVFDSALKNN